LGADLVRQTDVFPDFLGRLLPNPLYFFLHLFDLEVKELLLLDHGLFGTLVLFDQTGHLVLLCLQLNGQAALLLLGLKEVLLHRTLFVLFSLVQKVRLGSGGRHVLLLILQVVHDVVEV
jgi:hypothetical protein